MDLEKAIRELLAERERISGIISQLELIQNGRAPKPARRLQVAKPKVPKPEGPKPELRGRKSMSDAERETVSNRMRQYWEERRKAKDSSPEPIT
jgi:hypothetical protein